MTANTLSVREWCHRRWRPTTTWRNQVHRGVEFQGDPVLPPKGIFTGWRRKWAWGLMSTSAVFEEHPVWLEYSFNREFWRRTWLSLRTPYVAALIGREDVMFALVGKSVYSGEEFHAELNYVGHDLTYGEVFRRAGTEKVTFV